MTREIKANLIFLVALILLVSPGFVILMHKRLNGPSKPIFMADPVPVTAAYNQPPPVPPNLPRVEPAIVKSWAVKLLQADVGDAARLLRTSDDPAAGPVMGDRYVTQGISVEPSPDATIVRLMAWDGDPLTTDSAKITGSLSEKNIAGGVTEMRSVDVPPYVRHALQDNGFIDPPPRVAWIICKFAGPVDRLQIDLPSRKLETMTVPLMGASMGGTSTGMTK